MNTRIQKFIEAEGLTAARFADAIGVQRSNVSHVLSGRNKPGFDFIEKMLRKFPELNSEWLILGKGNMYKELHMPSLFNVPTVENLDKPKSEPINTASTGADSKNSSVSALEQSSIPEKVIHQNGKKLARILLCYSDGSFEVFDNNANIQ